MQGFLDGFVGIILGITERALQHIVMPKVKRWITKSSWSGMSFMSCQTSDPYSPS